ncbi:Hypothetical_protein [Hexamita inflata]|uniref:Hypothetical_protein n=1 Tax=Hexamita inflata TaxID=28002 RepID=A0AA86VSG4_9EUKA|nr:Hypothetical protein HINF_LOCUS63573 [Hexamita inflata]
MFISLSYTWNFVSAINSCLYTVITFFLVNAEQIHLTQYQLFNIQLFQIINGGFGAVPQQICKQLYMQLNFRRFIWFLSFQNEIVQLEWDKDMPGFGRIFGTWEFGGCLNAIQSQQYIQKILIDENFTFQIQQFEVCQSRYMFRYELL